MEPKAELSENEFNILYENFLRARGINSQKIKEQKYKTPDLQIFYENKFYLNEVKIPELIFDPIQNVYVFKTIHSKLLEFISRAVKQLESYDKEHKVPWVITFSANHFQLNWKKFTDAISGGVEFDGKLDPDFTNTHVFKRTQLKILVPDLYIWLQVSADNTKLFQVSYFINPNSAHKSDINDLVATLEAVKLSTMDNRLELSI